MIEPPKQLDGAEVLRWVVSGSGGFYHLTGSNPPVMVVAMAVARYADGGPFYLFKCDQNWQVVFDLDCGSIDEAQALATEYSNGELLVWQQWA